MIRSAPDARRRRTNRIAFITIVCLLLAGAAWMELARLNAKWVYNRSRPFQHGGPDSFEFLSFGVAAGDSETIVDQKLATASVMFGPGPTGLGSQDTMKWYTFHYGRDPYSWQGEPLLTEWIFVYFDADGGAVTLEHSLRSDSPPLRRVLNLKTRSVQQVKP